MQSSLLWRRAILRVASATEENLEAQIIRLFFTEVGMVYDEDLSKVRFICPGEYVYRTFAPYSWRFYLELKAILGVKDLGFSLEAVSSREYQLLQRNGSLCDRQTLAGISLEVADGEDIGSSVFAVSPCIAMDGAVPSVNIPMGAAGAAAHAFAQPLTAHRNTFSDNRSFTAGGNTLSSLHATQQPPADCASGMSSSHAAQQPQADCASGMSSSHAAQQPQGDCASGISSSGQSQSCRLNSASAETAQSSDNSNELPVESSYPEHDTMAVQSASVSTSEPSTCKDGSQDGADDTACQYSSNVSASAGTASSFEAVGTGASADYGQADSSMNMEAQAFMDVTAGRTTAAHGAAASGSNAGSAEAMAHMSSSLDRNGEAAYGHAMSVADNIDLTAQESHTAGLPDAEQNEAAPVNRSDAASASGEAGAACAAAGSVATEDQSVPAANASAAGAASDFAYQAELASMKAAAAASADPLRIAGYGMFAEFMALADEQIEDLPAGGHFADRTEIAPDYRFRLYKKFMAWAVSRGLIVDTGKLYLPQLAFHVNESGNEVVTDIYGSLTIYRPEQIAESAALFEEQKRNNTVYPYLYRVVTAVTDGRADVRADLSNSLDSLTRALRLGSMTEEQRSAAQNDSVGRALVAFVEQYKGNTAVVAGWAVPEHSAQSGESSPVQTGQSHPAQTGQSHPAQTGQSYPAQTGQSYPAQTGQSYPVQSTTSMAFNAEDVTAVSSAYGAGRDALSMRLSMVWDSVRRDAFNIKAEPAAERQNGMLAFARKWDSHGSDFGFMRFDGLYTEGYTIEQCVKHRLSLEGPYGQMPWDGAPVFTLREVIMCSAWGSQVIDSYRNFRTVRGLAARDLTDRRVIARLAGANYVAYKCLLSDLMCYDSSFITLRPFVRDKQASRREFAAQFNLNTAKVPGLPKRAIEQGMFMAGVKVEQGSDYSRPSSSKKAYYPNILLAKSFGMFLYLENYRVPATDLRKATVYCIDSLEMQFAAAAGINLKAPAIYREWTYEDAAHQVHHLVRSGEDISLAVENGYSFNYSADAGEENVHGLNGLSLAEQIEQISGWSSAQADDFDEVMTLDEAYYELSSRAACIRRNKELRFDESVAVSDFIWVDITLEAASIIAASPRPVNVRDQEIYDIACAAVAHYGPRTSAVPVAAVAAPVVSAIDDLADQGEDPESDEVLASFDGDAGNNQVAITDGTILDIRHESADDSQADDVLFNLADDESSQPVADLTAAGQDDCAQDISCQDNTETATIAAAADAEAATGTAAEAAVAVAGDELSSENLLTSGSQTHDGSWSRHEVCESDSICAAVMAGADSAGPSACDVAAGADSRVINVVDTSDYNSFDTPVFKQSPCENEAVLAFYARLAHGEPVAVEGMCLDVNDKARRDGMLERDYLRNEGQSASEKAAGWRAPFALTNADGSAVPLPEDQAADAAHDMQSGSTGAEPDALMAMINERRMNMAAAMGRDLSLAGAVNEDIAVQAARTWVAPSINVESGASAAMSLFDDSFLPCAENTHHAAITPLEGMAALSSGTSASDLQVTQSIIGDDQASVSVFTPESADSSAPAATSVYAAILGDQSSLPAALASGMADKGFDDRFVPESKSSAAVDLAKLRSSIPGSAVPALPGTTVKGVGFNGASYDELRAMELRLNGLNDDLNEHICASIWDTFYVDPSLLLPHRENVTLESLGEIDTRSLEERLQDDLKAAFSHLIVAPDSFPGFEPAAPADAQADYQADAQAASSDAAEPAAQAASAEAADVAPAETTVPAEPAAPIQAAGPATATEPVEPAAPAAPAEAAESAHNVMESTCDDNSAAEQPAVQNVQELVEAAHTAQSSEEHTDLPAIAQHNAAQQDAADKIHDDFVPEYVDQDAYNFGEADSGQYAAASDMAAVTSDAFAASAAAQPAVPAMEQVVQPLQEHQPLPVPQTQPQADPFGAAQYTGAYQQDQNNALFTGAQPHTDAAFGPDAFAGTIPVMPENQVMPQDQLMPEQPLTGSHMHNGPQVMPQFGGNGGSLEDQFAAVMAQVESYANVDLSAQNFHHEQMNAQSAFQAQVQGYNQMQPQLHNNEFAQYHENCQTQMQQGMHNGIQPVMHNGMHQSMQPYAQAQQPYAQTRQNIDFDRLQQALDYSAQPWLHNNGSAQSNAVVSEQPRQAPQPAVQPQPAAAAVPVQPQQAPQAAQPAQAAVQTAVQAHTAVQGQGAAEQACGVAKGAGEAPVLVPGQRLHNGLVELTAFDIANARRMYETALTSPDRSVLQSPYAAVNHVAVMGQQSLMPGQMPNVGLGLPGVESGAADVAGVPAEDKLLIPVIPGRGRENRPRGRASSLPVPVNSSRFNELYGDLSDPEKFKEAAARRAGESTYSKVLFPYMPTAGISEADRRIYDDYMVLLNAHYQSEVPLGEAISYSDFRKLGGSAATRTLLSSELARLPAIEAANARMKAQQERHMQDMNNLQNLGIMADGSWGNMVPDYAWRDPSDPTPVLPEAPLPPEMVANMSRRRRMAESAGIPKSAFELPERVINPKKTFEKLFFDSNGRAAVKSALDICQVASPDVFHCPVLVTGSSGTGKTHLLNAIANRIRCEQPDLRVALVSSDDFIKHFVESIAEMNKNRFSDKHVYLKAAFEAVDVLLLDDVQAFTKAVKSRWTVTDIIDFFSSTPGKRLVVTSSLSAAELAGSGVESDMISRLTSGITVDLSLPDIFYRRRMVRMLSDDLRIKPTDECVEYISWHLNTNGREIEGLVRSMANSMESMTIVDLEELNRQIGRIVSVKEEDFPVESVIALVCEHFGVSVQDVMSASKKANISMARSFAMCAVRDCDASLSLTDMGRLFKKDHSSVHEAIVRTRRRMAENVELRNRYSSIIESIEKFRAG